MRQVILIGGPWDGLTFWAADPGEYGDGAYMITPGSDRRAIYEPDPSGDPDVWLYRGTIG